ncbi:hypothetical protein GCM10010193_53880 [Kitasatospora atroaurantiaca]|uniref:Galactan 5-O-arabinofuranosyltransferase n=1 Tax=Kitasatospora atroaurantiaca TaxID=285545 RepID=A0A561EQ34_9ACTN|nr:galactan 5-O-arabinofuranosyltransferase [Kitasatospora atroaurantiaca]
MADVATEAPDDPQAFPAEPAAPAVRGGARAHYRRLLAAGAEAAVALGVGVAFMVWARNIHVDPLIRIGQVSGLAKLQFRAALLALPLLAVVLYAAHRSDHRRFRLLLRLGCAAVAGLGTGIVAGGIAVALRGTPWGLGGQDGDPATLQGYAESFLRGEGLPDLYPPGFVVLLAEWTKYLRPGHVGYALKDLQLLLSAVFGPLCYLAWRSLLRPAWALAVALPAAILFLDPIRPYSHLVMVLMLPLLGRLLTELSRVRALSIPSALLRGVALGAAFGLLFLGYSGWFVWSAPGALVGILALVPWRHGRSALARAGVLLGGTALAAGLVGAPLLLRMAQHGAAAVDRYAYFDVYIDPAYVMGWRYDRSGWPASWAWPPPGELAGQGTFTLLVLAGLALALALGLRRPAVVAALSCLAGAWVLRFWFAGHMQRDQAVMLYPRTTWLILYALITLTVLAAMLLSGGVQAAWQRLTARQAVRLPRFLGRRLAAGSLCGLAVFGAMAGSWSANRYMPSDPAKGDMGLDAWRSHTLERADGSCSPYAPGHTCTAPHELWRPQDSKDVRIWCGNVPYTSWTEYCGGKPPAG